MTVYYNPSRVKRNQQRKTNKPEKEEKNPQDDENHRYDWVHFKASIIILMSHDVRRAPRPVRGAWIARRVNAWAEGFHEYTLLIRAPSASACVAPNLSHTMALSRFVNKAVLYFAASRNNRRVTRASTTGSFGSGFLKHVHQGEMRRGEPFLSIAGFIWCIGLEKLVWSIVGEISMHLLVSSIPR